MYIQPNGEVRLLYNVPLDSDYNDTLYFASQTAQFNYFINHSGVSLPSDQSYTRVDKGIFRCSLPMSQTYNVNYMMFRNTAFENKWFYAFVDKISYTNNGLCEVHFTIDVIQTWLFNGSMQNALGECFVEREIVADDSFGAHIEPETLQPDEYVYDDAYTYIDYAIGTMKYIVMAVDTNGKAEGNVYDNTYTGAKFYACDTESQVNDILNKDEYKNKPDSIVGIYVVPSYAVPTSEINSDHTVKTAASGPYRDYTMNGHGTEINGYTPKNNKLFTYPYNFCELITGDGQGAVYRYEFFEAGTPKFRLFFNMLPPVAVVCEPRGYKNLPSAYDPTTGITSTDNSDPTNSLTLTGYPMCSWNYDAYAVWQVQEGAVNQVNTIYSVDKGATDIAVGAVGLALAPATGGLSTIASAGMIAKGGGNILDSIRNNYMAKYQASFKADVIKGNVNSGSTLMAHDRFQFYTVRSCITAKRAKQIDDFFSMFGYAVSTVKQPNISSRPQWNYAKCTDVNINAAMPTDDKNTLKAIFNNGIRFWKNPANVGNYSLANK